jgi:hypothetical protein
VLGPPRGKLRLADARYPEVELAPFRELRLGSIRESPYHMVTASYEPLGIRTGRPRPESGARRLAAWCRKTIERGVSCLKRNQSDRDFVLLLIGAAYAIGYVVWSINAWKNHLGLLPALRAQYLLAGSIPLLVIALVVFLMAAMRAAFDRLVRSKPWQRYALGAGLVCLGAAGSIAIVLPAITTAFPNVIKDRALGIAVTSLLLGLVYGGFVLMLPGATRPLRHIPVYGTPLGLGVAAFVGYFFVLYPRIPQEFGGVKAECAVLDLKRVDSSTSLLKAVGESPPVDTTGAIATSNELEVLFVGNDFVVARPLDDPASVLHIKKDVVASVQRRDDQECDS